MPVLPIACLKDNYAYLLYESGGTQAVVIDPGESGAIVARLEALGLRLDSVLLTHHHWDHSNGVVALVERFGASVFVHRADLEQLGFAARPVQDNERLATAIGPIDVLHVPGHTKGSAAYLWQGGLFTGDTLFSGGCGRLFEGTAEQMHASLMRLGRLSGETRVYCGHEYALHNLEFARKVEPSNGAIARRIELTLALRGQGLPSVPSTLEQELETNPFLRCKDASSFVVLRHRKDEYIP